jgi:CHAD domain-containing protein
MGTATIQILPPGTIAKRLGKLLQDMEALLAQEAALDAAGIHRLRRLGKRLRAWLRLWQDQGKLKGGGKTAALLGTAAAHYAALRDARVQRETLLRLPQLAGRDSSCDLSSILLLLPAGPTDIAAPLDPVLQRKLRKRLARLAATATLAEHPSQVQKGLRFTYRKAWHLLQNARETGDTEDLHRCRRWVKYLCYQLELVVQRSSGTVRQLHRHLEQLGTLLGEYHDVVLLQEVLVTVQQGLENADTAPDAGRLTQAVALCQAAQLRVLHAALELAANCFRASPKRFGTQSSHVPG